MPDDLSKDDDGNWVPEDPEFVKERSREHCTHEWTTYWVDDMEYPLCKLCGKMEGTQGKHKVIIHDDHGVPLWEPLAPLRVPWWRRAWRKVFG